MAYPIDYISQKLKIDNKELIEKDLVLHSFLNLLLKNNEFKENYVFKGGTCLTKCYLRYYRFSEDLDFTWINQSYFKLKSEKMIRNILSEEINNLMHQIRNISLSLSLDFKEDKKDNKYIEFGGSNKFVTFKIWYKSKVIKEEQFFKIQINFVETFFYEFKELKARSLVKDIDKKEIQFLFDNSEIVLEDINLKCYDIKEIFIEKVRAILTRRALKARDFIDCFMIMKRFNLNYLEFEEKIISKIKFMLKYEKYLLNLMSKDSLDFNLGDEEKLMLEKIDDKFPNFVKEFNFFLLELKKEVLK